MVLLSKKNECVAANGRFYSCCTLFYLVLGRNFRKYFSKVSEIFFQEPIRIFNVPHAINSVFSCPIEVIVIESKKKRVSHDTLTIGCNSAVSETEAI